MSTPVEDARREDRVFGHLLVQHQYITSEHLQECLAAQVAGAAAGTTPRLGEILLRKGYLTFEKLDQALAVLRESTILSCGACGYEAAVSAYDPSRQYICPAQTPGGPCRQPLGEKFVSGTAKATSRTLQTRVRDLPSDVAQAARNSKNVLGKYVLLGMLGRGGMGVVYKAFDTSLMRSVALKQLTLASDDDLKRFQREARTVAALKHPNIAAVYEFDTIDGKSVISMELIRGKPAHGLKLSVQSALRVVSEAAKAIDHAHAKGIIHRDLKPQNILVDEELKPHVLDFGLARAIQGGEKLTLSGMIVGTPSYMSPEQGSAEPGKVDRRTDVYGLGATLYHLLTGKPPFDGSTPVQILKKVLEEDPKPPRVHNPSIPKEVEAICLQAMDRDPARRYASAAELAADIESYLSGKPIRAHARSIATRLLRKAHRGRKTLVAIAGTAAVLTMAGIGWVVISKGDQAARVKQYLAAGDRLRAEGDYQHAVAEYSKAKGLDARNALVEERIVDCRAKLNEIERTRQAKLEEERSAKESAEAEQGRAEEGKRKAEEGQRKAEEAQRAAEEAERRADEERRQAEEARKAAEAEKVRTEAERREAERRAAEESARASEEERRRKEEEEARRREEEARRAAEEAARGREDPKRAKAQPAFDRGIKNLDESVRNLYRKGADLAKNRTMLEGAVREFNEALKLAPRFHEALHGRGRAYQMLGDYKDADRDYTQALKVAPQSLSALRSRALLDLERSLDWQFSRGWIGAAAGNDPFRKKANADLKSLRKKMADELENLVIEAHLAYSERETDAAIRLCGEALAINDALEEIHKLLGDALQWRYLFAGAAVDGQTAERAYTRAIELRVNFVAAYKMRGALRFKLGRAAEAEADFLEARKINPEDPAVLMSLGIFAAHQKRWADAVDLLTRAVDRGDDSVFVFNARGTALMNLGKHGEALKDFDQAVRISPDYASAYRNRGTCHYFLKEPDKARRDLEKAISLDPRMANDPTVKQILDAIR